MAKEFQVPVGVPRLTASEISALASPQRGWLVYDTTNNTLKMYDGSAWSPIATGGISGSGTSGKLTKWTGTSALGDSVVVESSSKIGIGMTPVYTLDVAGDVNISTGSVFRINGTQISSAALSDGVPNTRSISTGTGLSGGGNLSADRTISLANTAVTPNPYGSATQVATFTVDQQGRLTAAGNTSIQISEGQVTNLTSDLSNKIDKSIVDAKGDLIVATANDTVTRLPIGITDGHVLTVDSGQASGMKWAAAGGGSGSSWVKYTKTYSDLSAAALTNDIELFSLAAKEFIENVVIKHSTAFAGTSITAYRVSVGLTGNLTKYASQFDVFQAIGSAVAQASAGGFVEDFTSVTSVRLSAVSIGANLDAATAGSVDIWVKKGTLP